jgi:rSAM/selenodomain-associated transferase 2/rSAM/selenodomain-associated transferase 1
MTHADSTRLILFTRYPAPGKTKTRLIPLLGESGAASLARRLTLRTLRTAHALEGHPNLQLEIRYDGGSERAMRHWLGQVSFLREQGPGDLGQRMARAFDDSFREGATRTIIIGSDCPGLTPARIEQGFDRLATHPVVLGPATDGGYFLVGLNRPVPELFAGIDWGTDTVLDQSMKILQQLTIVPELLDPLEDLDRPEEVARWQQAVAAEEQDLGRVSVIIPTLNEAENLAETLGRVQQGNPAEIIVADGGSKDDSVELARCLGAHVVTCPQGRATQLNTGASLARGNTLLFLHADTWLPRDWVSAVAWTLAQPNVAAGAFGFGVRESFPGRGMVEFTTNLRSRWLQAPYGDQGLFLRRAYFEELGGYADMPIMEDYEIVRRLRGYGRIITLRDPAPTSGRRWQQLGWLQTTATNHLIVAAYHLGVSPERLEHWYCRNPNPWQSTAAGPSSKDS